MSYPGGHDERYDVAALDQWIADYITAAVSEEFSMPGTPRAARVTPEFYEDLQSALVRAERLPSGPWSLMMSVCAFLARVLSGAEWKAREALESREEILRIAMENYVEAAIVSRGAEEAVRKMQLAGREWSEIAEAANPAWKKKAGLLKTMLVNLGCGNVRVHELDAAKRLINASSSENWARVRSSGPRGDGGPAGPWVRVAGSVAGSAAAVATIPLPPGTGSWSSPRRLSIGSLPAKTVVIDDDAEEAGEDHDDGCNGGPARQVLIRGPAGGPEDEFERFQCALDELVAAGESRNVVSRMVGFKSNNAKRDVDRILGNVRLGIATALARLPGFYAALEEWRAKRLVATPIPLARHEDRAGALLEWRTKRPVPTARAVEEPGSESDGDGEICSSETLIARLPQIVWTMEAVDDLLSSGVSYGDLSRLLGYNSPNNCKRSVSRFLARAFRSDRINTLRTAKLRLVVERQRRFRSCHFVWGSPPSRTSDTPTPAAIAWATVYLQGEEEYAREILDTQEKDGLISIVEGIVGSPGCEAAWLMALVRIKHLTGLGEYELADMAGCGVWGVRSSTRTIMAALAQDPAGPRGVAERLRMCVLEDLMCVKFLSVADREYLELVDTPYMRTCARAPLMRAKIGLREIAAGLVAEEVKGRSYLAATEEICRSTLGLSVARLNPKAWLRRTVLRLRGEGVGWAEISEIAGYAGQDPEADVRRLLCGLDVWRLSAAWDGLRRRELRKTAALPPGTHAIFEAEAGWRHRIEAEQAGFLGSIVRRMRMT